MKCLLNTLSIIYNVKMLGNIMIKISELAQKHFIKLLKKQKKNTNIKVFVVNPGTQEAECGVSYCYKDTVKDNDIEIKFSKFSVFIDYSSKQYLINSEIDLVKDNLGVQLTLKAPYAKLKKISEDSTLFDKINFFIQKSINPQLSNHGGMISLIDINIIKKNRYALIKFGGGCNGCSMVSVTLKKGIEKELLKNFPELHGIKDITDHKSGLHSYY